MKSVEKQYGDHFLQPTTVSALIKMQYFVKVKTEYDVICLCCSPTPKAIIHINLAPGQGNINLPYAPPSDFQMVVGQPIVHDMVNHNLQQQPYNALPVLGQQGEEFLCHLLIQVHSQDLHSYSRITINYYQNSIMRQKRIKRRMI